MRTAWMQALVLVAATVAFSSSAVAARRPPPFEPTARPGSVGVLPGVTCGRLVVAAVPPSPFP